MSNDAPITAARITRIVSRSSLGTASVDQHITLLTPEAGPVEIHVARFEGRVRNVNIDLPTGRRLHDVGGSCRDLAPGVDEYDSTCVAHLADIIRRHV